jgi:hypothetical protein
MDHAEAIAVLERELSRFRDESYAQLVARVDGDVIVVEQTAASGAVYQLEIQCMWDDKPGGNILVMGGVDDGGWRAFAPLSRSFIKAPDGSFVGE